MELLQARCRTDRKIPEGRTEAQPNHSAYWHRQRIWRGVPCDPVVPCGGDMNQPSRARLFVKFYLGLHRALCASTKPRWSSTTRLRASLAAPSLASIPAVSGSKALG